MITRQSTTLAILLALGAGLAGCKEDPPPPPMPSPKASAAKKDVPAIRPASREVPDYSEETTRRFRLELCHYGAVGLAHTRDVYLASLAGAAPSPDKLPAFADDGEEKDSAKIAPMRSFGRRRHGRLPTTRFVSSCSLAARSGEATAKKGSDAEAKDAAAPAPGSIEAALAEFEPWASELNRQLMAAERYYASKQYEKDDFKRGKATHEALVKAFGELDGKLASFGKAFTEWQSTWTPTEKLDEAGVAGEQAMTKARALAATLLAPQVDAAAVQKAIDELKQARAALAESGDKDDKAPHPRVLGARLDKLLEQAERAHKAIANGKLPNAERQKIGTEMAMLAESHYRAVGQVLRALGKTEAAPGAAVSPRLDAGRARPALRIRPRGRPATAGEGDKKE